MYTKILLILLFALFLVDLKPVSALSNESINASNSLMESQRLMDSLISRNISVQRVNETFQEASQLYSAQLALEKQGGHAVYSQVMKDTESIKLIYDVAIQAQDDLIVFRKYLIKTEMSINVSEAQSSIDDVEISFSQERFEDTPNLIDTAYNKISEVTAKQTTMNLFYSTTSKSIGKFFQDNWKIIIIVVSAVLILLFILWNRIQKLRLRIKVDSLLAQKQALGMLVRKLQEDYFDKGKISEAEYTVKIERFKEMIRDVDRQLPLLNEALFKLDEKSVVKQSLPKTKVKPTEKSSVLPSIKRKRVKKKR